MSPIAPPAVMHKVLEKGEFFNDGGFHFLAVVWIKSTAPNFQVSLSLSFDDIYKVGATFIPKNIYTPLNAGI